MHTYIHVIPIPLDLGILEGDLQKCIDKEWLGGENDSAEILIKQTPFF